MSDDKQERRGEVELADGLSYEPSTAQLDAERRANEDSDGGGVAPHLASVNPSYGVVESGFIGVNPEYRNAADQRQMPYNPEDGWTESLQVEPAEDAGQPSLPFVAEHRAGGPAVEAGDEVVLTSTSAEAPTKRTTPSPTPPRTAAKSSTK